MEIREILLKIKEGEMSFAEAEKLLRLDALECLSDRARLDIHRARRSGIPEAVLGEGKTPEDVVGIAEVMSETGERVIITRVSHEQYAALTDRFEDMRWNEDARVAVVGEPVRETGGRVGVVSAGTADIGVAEEARVTAEEMGCETETIYDVGVAGIHRLFPELERLVDVDAVVVAAGREGTLPTVVAGLLDAPVIGVPVSTGYGYGAEGRAALMSMLQSCCVLSVVNIDAGFVAGAQAARIANKMASARNRLG